MKEKQRVLPLLACLTLLLTGCGAERQSLAADYPEIADNCQCYYGTQEKVLDMLRHGTGVVMLSWVDCPWCHRYIQYLNAAAANAEIDVLCYDIYEDREAETDFYRDVCSLLSAQLDAADAYDAAGKLRIYVPTVVFVADGQIIGHSNETAMISGTTGDIEAAISQYWSGTADNGQTREYNTRKQLTDWCCQLCKALAEIESRGCQGCPVTR